MKHAWRPGKLEQVNHDPVVGEDQMLEQMTMEMEMEEDKLLEEYLDRMVEEMGALSITSTKTDNQKKRRLEWGPQN